MKNISKVGMIALGCEKNRIDAEIMLAEIEKAGYEICFDEEECDAIIVHTCAFIDKAKEESIDNILSTAGLKGSNLKKLIVTGCLAERYRDQIFEEIPEVDCILGVRNAKDICKALEAESGFSSYAPLDQPAPEGERVLTSPEYSVFLRIAEGCSNHCSYCVIPQIRGEFQPRTYDSIMEEAFALALNGAKEINLIAQDTTAYPELCRLIRDIAKIESIKWIRILYCRPEEISDELLDLMASEPKFVAYIDVPLQHASGKILKAMNRTSDDVGLLKLIDHLREKVPGVSLRTTFMSGFPTETDEDHEVLCNFVKNARFNNLGVFEYSAEENTIAGQMEEQVPQEVKEERANQIMLIQMNQIDNINEAFIGKTYDVLCEGFDEDVQKNTGRAYFQAPDVDGRIYFDGDCTEGEFYRVTLDSSSTYDFFGHLAEGAES